jgi:hypothetical protein
VAVAASTFACAALFSPGWSEQGGLSLSVNKAEAQKRVYITRGYAVNAIFVEPGNLGRREGLLLWWPLEWSWVQLHRLG